MKTMLENKTILEGNLAIAEMVHGKRLDKMFVMCPVPPIISNSTWIGYTEHSAHFHDSYEWQAIVLEFILKLGYEYSINSFYGNGSPVHICSIKRQNSVSVTSNFSEISCCNAIFFALVKFANLYNNKKLG